PGRVRLPAVMGGVLVEQPEQHRGFPLDRSPRSRGFEGPGDPITGRIPSFAQDPRGEGPGGLDVTRVVEEDEGLLRDVRPAPFGGAFLASRRVERLEARMEE